MLVLLHKKGSMEEFGNFKPIALINMVLKVLSALANKSLTRVFEEKGFLDYTQPGFLQGQSAVGQAAAFVEVAGRLKAKGRGMYGIVCLLPGS